MGPTLRTERLVLRLLQPSDAEAIFVARGDPEVCRYWSSPALTSVESTRAELERSTDLESAIVWAVTRPDDDAALGWVTLMHVREGVDEVGIILRREVWRRGYAGEAIEAAITYGLETRRKHRMMADIDPDNEASIQLFDRLGFTLEGRLRDNWLISGKRYDSLIYGLLDHEWRARDGTG